MSAKFKVQSAKLVVLCVLLLPMTGRVVAQSVEQNAVLASIDQKGQAYAKIAMQIWSFAEVGYQETKSSALLQDQLRAAGFTVNAGVAEIPTAFTATWGSGKPVIGIIGEFDALPGLSQAAGRRWARSRLRASPLRHGLDGRGDRGEGLARCEQTRRHDPLLWHAGRRGRLRQGLHAARGPV